MRLAWEIAQRIHLGTRGSFIRLIIRLGIASVALSFTVLLMTISIIAGFQKEVTNKIYDFWGHIHVTDLNSDRSVDAVPMRFDDRLVEKITEVGQISYMDISNGVQNTKGGVAMVTPFIHHWSLLQTSDEFIGVLSKGVDERFNWSQFEQYVIEGSWLPLVDSSGTHALISKVQADLLEVEVGDKVLLQFILPGSPRKKRRLKVAGIYETGLEEYDERFTLVPLSFLQRTLGWEADVVTGASVLLDHHEDIQHLNEYLYLEVLPEELYSQSVRDKFKGIFEWIEVTGMTEKVLIVIMLVVCFVNLSTVMIVLIIERARMIGVLKALGARTALIVRLFVLLMGRILLKGLIIGNVLAIILCYLQDRLHIIKLKQEDYYLSYAPIDLSWQAWLSTNLFILIVVTLFMFIPAMIISSIRPTKILRFR